MEVIQIKHLNETYAEIIASRSVMQELEDAFWFWYPNYKHTPKYKAGLWSGKFHMIRSYDKKVYIGLLPNIEDFCKQRNYKIEYIDCDYNKQTNIDEDYITKYIMDLNICVLDKQTNKYINITPRDYQISSTIQVLKNKRNVLLSATNCHKKGDLVLCYDGNYKPIEEIKIGDLIVGSDGNPKKVLRLYSGNTELFEIDPKTNREKITVTGEHILPLHFSDTKRKSGFGKGDYDYIEYISVNDYINKHNYYKHCSRVIYNNNPVNFEIKPNTCNLPPYFIGLYLGDGSVGGCQITTIDKEIIEYLYEIAPNIGCEIRKYDISYNLINKQSSNNQIIDEFRKIGLNIGNTKKYTTMSCERKHIPKILFNSSIEYRYELLAGLLDSDGHLHNNTYFEFTVKSKQLAEDVKHLSISLGLVAIIRKKFVKKYPNNIYYRVIIMGDIHKIPTKIKRKTECKVDRFRNPYRSMFTVKSIGEHEFYGMEVEDSLYITNGGMITHNSGKTVTAYLICRYLLDHGYNNGLIITPRVDLIRQGKKDFIEYSHNNKWDAISNIDEIYSGMEKFNNTKLKISTYQSLTPILESEKNTKSKRSYFEQFDFVIVDETHQASNRSISDILAACINCKYRIGMTGSLKENAKVNNLVIQSLLGVPYNVLTAKESIDRGESTKIDIKCYVLEHTSKNFSDYDHEIKYIENLKERNDFIIKLCGKIDKNVLIIFKHIKHGKYLFEQIKELYPERKVYMYYGDIKQKERDQIKSEIELEKNAIILATDSTFSTGLNIKSLDDLIMAYPYKSNITIQQSCGRLLRVKKGKDVVTIHDIADDFGGNITYKHFKSSRIKIYKKQQFQYKIYKVQL